MSSTQTITALEEPPAAAPIEPVHEAEKRKLGERLADTVKRFWDLGFISFGGPGVHVVILRKRFVDKLKWIDETTFADLFALGNALPGPGSTQLAFSIALVRNGTLAGLLAFLMWSIPGAAGMAGLAAGVRSFPEQLPPIVLALLTGLNAAAVGLIALAAFQLSRTAITDKLTRLLVLGSACFGICYHAPWMYPVLVATGGILTLLWDYKQGMLDFVKKHTVKRRRRSLPSASQSSQGIELESMSQRSLNESRAPSIRNRMRSAESSTSVKKGEPATILEARHMDLMVLKRKYAIPLAVASLVVILALIITRSQVSMPPRWLDFFVNMIIAGVIIFGGGPVVIPLLREYTVVPGWVDSRDFLLGFAILQAFPGPNFNFATYLGVLALPQNPALGAFLGWLGIFSPGILLKLSLLPLYNTWRKNQIAKSVLRGLNAAAAGLVWTAVWQLFLVGYIYTPASGNIVNQATASGPLTSDPFWGAVAASAFTATQWFGCPPPFSILGGGLAGLAWYGVVGEAGTIRQPI
ncbi:hypothetical protein P389DRAFT_55026 [Cystobasidium minutum MCA 4210]|uniref:uncharacterized protein n=1 Tax=Cystobasidium minutum MCA 4210 TaxID=1397322 RepID=UPI0034CE7287|eukprot:jgi/Rhomi1/55026/CE55025_1453